MQRVTEIEYRPQVTMATEPPPCLFAHFAPKGFDVCFDSKQDRVIVARHGLGREPILAEELDAETVIELRGLGYKIDPQDDTVTLGDGCFYKHPVELRNQMRSEEAEYLRRQDSNETFYDALDDFNKQQPGDAAGRRYGRIEPRQVPTLSEQVRPGTELLEQMRRMSSQ